ncbi:MAG: hypothetical protein JWN86_3324 [Planctomycetota bacterium]|nr:hypothetical protein [Planctomycetota bacterium]
MNGPRWKLSDLLLVVLSAGVAMAAYRYFWQPAPNPNARLYLAAYLALLSTASLGAFFGRPGWRRLFRGYALFGWCNLAFVMWGGFGLSTIYDARRLVEGSQMGVVFGVLSGLVATWLFEPPGVRDVP